jgi:hypothetical protein
MLTPAVRDGVGAPAGSGDAAKTSGRRRVRTCFRLAGIFVRVDGVRRVGVLH